MICSGLNLTALSIERFPANMSLRVCSVSQARRVVAVAWILATILALPRNLIQVKLASCQCWKDQIIHLFLRLMLKLEIQLMVSTSLVFQPGMTGDSGRCFSCTCSSSSWSFLPLLSQSLTLAFQKWTLTRQSLEKFTGEIHYGCN